MRFFLAVLMVLTIFNTVAMAEKGSFVYDDQGRRDPFWQLVSPSGAILNYETEFLITDLALEGIMAGEDGQNYAIINGRILKAADVIGQFIVERIDDNGIILKMGTQKFELKLKKEE
jgi:hypothetical protein